MYLPKPEKDKSKEIIHTAEYHKKIITSIVNILKKRFNQSGMILLQ